VRPTMLRGAPRWWPRTRASRWAKVPNTPKFLGFWPKVQHGPSRRGEPCRLGSARAGASVGGFLRVLRGQVETDTGEMIDTGPLSTGGGHAGLGGDLTAAISHYDDVSSAVADVAVGEDAHGIWMAGALRPTVTPEQVRTLRASSVSGDWRPMGRHLALVAVLAVNVPGFSVPRPQLAASGEPVALSPLASLCLVGEVRARPKRAILLARSGLRSKRSAWLRSNRRRRTGLGAT
jgi:hypothetical protein